MMSSTTRKQQQSTSLSLAVAATVLPAVPEKPITDEQLIEFEQALLAQTVVPCINNPCMKRTMNFGPKKLIGTVANNLVHQHTNKKTMYADFDTFSML